MSFVKVTGAGPDADCPAFTDTAATVRINATDAGRANRMTYPSSEFTYRTRGPEGPPLPNGTRRRVPFRSVGQLLERIVDDPGLRQVLGVINDRRVPDPLTAIG